MDNPISSLKSGISVRNVLMIFVGLLILNVLLELIPGAYDFFWSPVTWAKGKFGKSA